VQESLVNGSFGAVNARHTAIFQVTPITFPPQRKTLLLNRQHQCSFRAERILSPLSETFLPNSEFFSQRKSFFSRSGVLPLGGADGRKFSFPFLGDAPSSPARILFPFETLFLFRSERDEFIPSLPFVPEQFVTVSRKLFKFYPFSSSPFFFDSSFTQVTPFQNMVLRRQVTGMSPFSFFPQVQDSLRPFSFLHEGSLASQGALQGSSSAGIVLTPISGPRFGRVFPVAFFPPATVIISLERFF